MLYSSDVYNFLGVMKVQLRKDSFEKFRNFWTEEVPKSDLKNNPVIQKHLTLRHDGSWSGYERNDLELIN